jgi:uncharacterized protein
MALMSGALHSWYSLPDLAGLAQRRVVLEGTIKLASCERLKALLNSDEGSVEAKLVFSKGHDDLLLMQLQCDARLELICQRCLKPVVHEVSEQVDFAIADNEASLALVPQGVDLIALQGDRFQPAALIEDELIVSLPLVPRHGDDQQQEIEHGCSEKP